MPLDPSQFIGATLEPEPEAPVAPSAAAPAAAPASSPVAPRPAAAAAPTRAPEEDMSLGDMFTKGVVEPGARGAVRAGMTGADIAKLLYSVGPQNWAPRLVSPYWGNDIIEGAVKEHTGYEPRMYGSEDMIRESGLPTERPTGALGYLAAPIEGAVGALGIPAGKVFGAATGALSGLTGQAAAQVGGEDMRPVGELVPAGIGAAIAGLKNWLSPAGRAGRLVEEGAKKAGVGVDEVKALPGETRGTLVSQVPEQLTEAAKTKHEVGSEFYKNAANLAGADHRLFDKRPIWMALNRTMEEARRTNTIEEFKDIERQLKSIGGTLFGTVDTKGRLVPAKIDFDNLDRQFNVKGKLNYHELIGVEQNISAARKTAMKANNGAALKALGELDDAVDSLKDAAINGGIKVPKAMKESFANAQQAWREYKLVDSVAAGKKIDPKELDATLAALGTDNQALLRFRTGYSERVLDQLRANLGDPEKFARYVRDQAPQMTKVLGRGPDNVLPQVMREVIKNPIFSQPATNIGKGAISNIAERMSVGPTWLRTFAYVHPQGQQIPALNKLAEAMVYPDKMKEVLDSAGGNRQLAYQMMAYALANASRMKQQSDSKAASQ